jgi:hypothetical protein
MDYIRTPNSARSIVLGTPRGVATTAATKGLISLTIHSPFQQLVSEIDELSTFLTACTTNVSYEYQTPYDPRHLLHTLSSMLKHIIPAVLPYSSSSSGLDASGTLPGPSLSVYALVRMLDLISVILEWFPWSMQSITAFVLIFNRKNNSEIAGKDAKNEEDEEEENYLLTTARVRSNLSQRFDRIKRNSRCQEIATTNVANKDLVTNLLSDKTIAHSSMATGLYAKLVASSLSHRVKVTNQSPSTSASNGSKGQIPFFSATSDLKQKLTELPLYFKPLNIAEAGQWVESILDILHDLLCRHILLVETEFDYRHNAFQVPLSQALQRIVCSFAKFLQVQVHHSSSSQPFDGIGRYFTNLFERLSISRVQYHRSQYSSSIHSRLKSSYVEAATGSLPSAGGSNSLSSRHFSLLSSSSIAALLYQFSIGNTLDCHSIRIGYLRAMQSFLKDERCFAVFFKQQSLLLRQIHRSLQVADGSASSRGGQLNWQTGHCRSMKNENASGNLIPLLLWMVQEVCCLEDVFIPIADPDAKFNTSSQRPRSQVPETGAATTDSVSHLMQDCSEEYSVPVDEDEAQLRGVCQRGSHRSPLNKSSPQKSTEAKGSVSNPSQQRKSTMAQNPLTLNNQALQSILEILRCLLVLAQAWPDCVVALLLQIVPPQLAANMISSSSTGSISSSSTARPNTVSNMDTDGDEDAFSREDTAMTGVVAQLGHNSSTSSNATKYTSSSSADVTPIPPRSHTNSIGKRKRRGKKSRLQILDDILEEDEDDDEAADKTLRNKETRMDVDDATTSTSSAANASTIQGHGNCLEEIDWKTFCLTALQFEPLSANAVSAASSSIIDADGVAQRQKTVPLTFSTPILNGGQSHCDKRASSSMISVSSKAVQALSGIVKLAPSSSYRQNDSNGKAVFDTAFIVGISRVWMQLWQWCDMFPRSSTEHKAKSFEDEEYEESRNLLLEATSVCTRLLNVIVGVLRNHPQKLLILHDCKATLMAFFLRDILNTMCPDLRLHPSDYDHLDSLEE